jgi:hypothetical protein
MKVRPGRKYKLHSWIFHQQQFPFATLPGVPQQANLLVIASHFDERRSEKGEGTQFAVPNNAADEGQPFVIADAIIHL